MIHKAQEAFTATLIAAAVILIGLVSPGYAHENHQALGAGPGPEEPTEAVAPVTVGAAAPNEAVAVAHQNMADAHEMAAERHEQAADETGRSASVS